MISPDILRTLICPLDHPPAPLRQEGDLLVCEQCGHGFPARPFPNLLPEAKIDPERVREMLHGR